MPVDLRGAPPPGPSRRGAGGSDAPDPPSARARVLPTALVLAVFLIAALAVAVLAWRALGEVEMGLHGWIALALGALVTLLLGGGLMALLFYSARRGYDDRAGHF